MLSKGGANQRWSILDAVILNVYRDEDLSTEESSVLEESTSLRQAFGT